VEIHISSLAYKPATNGPNGSVVKYPGPKQQSTEQQRALPVERIPSVMPDAASLQQKYELSKTLNNPDQSADLDVRNRKALNAYAATLNQPVLEEKQAMAGIDFFV
jgi:hypothetical protein